MVVSFHVQQRDVDCRCCHSPEVQLRHLEIAAGPKKLESSESVSKSNRQVVPFKSFTPRKINMVHLRMTHLERKIIDSKPAFSGSMLIFGGATGRREKQTATDRCLDEENSTETFFLRPRTKRLTHIQGLF